MTLTPELTNLSIMFGYGTNETEDATPFAEKDLVVNHPARLASEMARVAFEDAIMEPDVKVVDDIPVVAQRQIPVIQIVQQTFEISQLQCTDKVVDDHVVQVVEKILEIAEIQTVPGTQTSESLGQHLSARWHSRKLWMRSRSERLFQQNPHHHCSSQDPSWKLLQSLLGMYNPLLL